MQKAHAISTMWLLCLTSLLWIFARFSSHGFTEACECGLSLANRVYNGYRVRAGDYPWMALLITVRGPKAQMCGATLISPIYLVTAGHCCLDSTTGSYSFVTFGTSGFVTAFRNSPRHAVEKFTRKSIGVSGKDIGVVKLQRAVRIQPICLPSKTATYADVKATMLGFGRTQYGDDSKFLLGGQVTVPSNAECSKVQPVNEGEICGGNYGGGPTFCSGDSGGPLMYYNSKSQRWELIGVVSKSHGCSSTDTYGYFTRVSTQIDWIQSNTNRAGCQK